MAAIRFGVKPAWNNILSRSWRGGSIPMNIERISLSGNTPVDVIPPSSEEYVRQSRLTVWMSSGRVTDQNPASLGNPLI